MVSVSKSFLGLKYRFYKSLKGRVEMIEIMVKFSDNSSDNFIAYFSRVPSVGDFIALSTALGDYPCCQVMKVYYYPFKENTTNGLIAGLIEVVAVS